MQTAHARMLGWTAALAHLGYLVPRLDARLVINEPYSALGRIRTEIAVLRGSEPP